jgi:hypothetical protein
MFRAPRHGDEVALRKGDVVNVPGMPGAFIVIGGDMRWDNGPDSDGVQYVYLAPYKFGQPFDATAIVSVREEDCR